MRCCGHRMQPAACRSTRERAGASQTCQVTTWQCSTMQPRSCWSGQSWCPRPCRPAPDAAQHDVHSSCGGGSSWGSCVVTAVVAAAGGCKEVLLSNRCRAAAAAAAAGHSDSATVAPGDSSPENLQPQHQQGLVASSVRCWVGRLWAALGTAMLAAAAAGGCCCGCWLAAARQRCSCNSSSSSSSGSGSGMQVQQAKHRSQKLPCSQAPGGSSPSAAAASILLHTQPCCVATGCEIVEL